MTLGLEKSLYRPGEMVTCLVEIENGLGRVVAVEMPRLGGDAKALTANIEFWVKRDGDTNARRRLPVHPKAILVDPPQLLAPEEKLSRRFGFIDLTIEPGVYFLQAHYSTLLDAKRDSRQVIASLPATFEVKGEPLWWRDEDGILLKEQAIQIAVKELGKTPARAQARLVINEAGLLDWWVTLERKPEDVASGQDPRVAYFINPYGCFVAAKATPFDLDEKPEENARILPRSRSRTE